MHPRSRPRAAVVATAFLSLAATSRAQGTYVNFEEPQIKPVAIATVAIGGVPTSFALVCNTPDNSVEIYTGAAPHAFVMRVPVGLAPVTVRWHAGQQRFFTCNFLGDSVTAVQLLPGGGTVTAEVERTVHVGDEPTDIVFPAGSNEALVALHSRSRLALVQASDLTKVGERFLQQADPAQPSLLTAVKAPRTLATLPDGRFYALNTMGGTADYDLDVYVEDPRNPPAGQATNVHLVGGMGSTNAGFAIDGVGKYMFVVGGLARLGPIGVEATAASPLGFVESRLFVVDLMPAGAPLGAAPVVVAEQVLGGSALLQSIDLNENYNSSSPDTAVPLSKRVSQPTDVVLVESNPGIVDHIVVASFGTDRVLVLTPSAAHNGGYQRSIVDLAVATPGSGYGSVGPRGLAHDPVTGLVWVANRLDQSLAVFAPGAPQTVSRIQLQADPTPQVIRTGRPFLYSAHRTSGNGMVACASCHVDARTDGLQWNLGHDGTVLGGPSAVPSRLVDVVDQPGATPYPTTFPTNKGVMITQSLQGLVNSHIESPGAQYLTTNAPYHWRGDKPSFQDFNEAFVNLQGMRDDVQQPGTNGLTASDMDAYTAFVETIHYPPNPEQPRTRVYGGSLGAVPDDLDNNGSGALYGMKIFHVLPTTEGRSCAHCHTLPEGSSNTFVLQFGTHGDFPLFPGVQQNPRENAALRGLLPREQALVLDFNETRATSWTRVAQFGLTHDGIRVQPGLKDQRSINDFNASTFALGQSPAIPKLTRLRWLNEFTRQFDWGVAPIIGHVMTVDTTHAVDAALLADMKTAVAEANAGLAVQVRTGGANRGYYYDVAVTPPVFRRVGGSNPLSEAQLLALVQGGNDMLVFVATPAGSERRVAHVAGAPTPLTGPSPSGVVLLPMVPNTAFVDVTKLTAGITPNSPTQSITAMRTMEAAARAAGIAGVAASPRHEPPRRFRVAGMDIRLGAKLVLGMAVGTPGSGVTEELVLDLAPTQYRHNGLVVWESLEEVDAKMTMELLNGGPELAAVRAVSDNVNPSGPLDPLAWNAYVVDVRNQDGTSVAAPVKQQLTIADQR